MTNLPPGNLAVSQRVASIDAFRGLTIITMIFVNDVASVKGVPWWMKHLPSDADGMTFVDLVFPAFLFIVGMAMPFAIGRRLERGASAGIAWLHILLRTAGLLAAGVLMVNMGGLDSAATGMPKPVWALLVYLGMILVWNIYPDSGLGRKAGLLLRPLGLLILVGLAAIYRQRTSDGELIWMRTQWWGILGLIGWAYLITALFYVPLRRHLAGMVAAVFLLGLMNVAARNKMFEWATLLTQWVDPGGQWGGHGSITAAGAVLGMILALPEWRGRPGADKLKWMLWFGLALFVAGWLVWKPYKISKDFATPAWCFICAGLCAWIFAGFYALMDMMGKTKWANWLRPAGENPLLAYILAPIIYAFVEMAGVNPFRLIAGSGVAGIGVSLFFTVIVVAITGLLGRAGLRLKF